MTQNQIAYQRLVEDRRHNQVDEALTSRRDAANRAIGIANAASNILKGATKFVPLRLGR